MSQKSIEFLKAKELTDILWQLDEKDRNEILGKIKYILQNDFYINKIFKNIDTIEVSGVTPYKNVDIVYEIATYYGSKLVNPYLKETAVSPDHFEITDTFTDGDSLKISFYGESEIDIKHIVRWAIRNNKLEPYVSIKNIVSHILDELIEVEDYKKIFDEEITTKIIAKLNK